VLAAVFSGDPACRNCNDVPQQCNKYGTTFSFAGGSLWMGEAQYAINQAKDAKGLAGVYKLGVWYATANFADQHFGLNGGGAVVSLADPAAAGPLNHAGNWASTASPTRWSGAAPTAASICSACGRFAVRPHLLSFYIDGGAGLKGRCPAAPTTCSLSVSPTPRSARKPRRSTATCWRSPDRRSRSAIMRWCSS